MKKYLLLIFFYYLTVYNTSFAQLSNLVAKTEKAVFRIETFDEFGVVSSIGTGFFIDKNGTGLTAWHVIENTKFAFIKDYSGKKYRIKKITRSNVNADIVEFILDTKENNFSFIPLATILPLKGTAVFTIGNPEGFESIVSTGVVSGLEIENSVQIIQTSTPISSGSSGGPLVNLQGQAIGVISSSFSKGQNLNFASSVLERRKMEKDSLVDLMSDINGSFYMLNIKSKYDPNLILNSIENIDSITVLNFSYTNLSIIRGSEAYVYCDTKNKDETYFIVEKDSTTKHYIKSSSLSETIDDAPTIKLGQSIHFYLIFDRIKTLKHFDLKENMKGSNWSFHDIIIHEKKYLTSEMFDKYNKSQFPETRMKLRSEEFTAAKADIDKLRDSIKNNELFEQLSSVASNSLGEFDEAIKSIKHLISLNPKHADYYANLYSVYMNMDSTSEALEYINKAIHYNHEYAYYFLCRGELNFKLERWKESIADYDNYLNLRRDDIASAYLSRGIAKAMIKDDGACTDLEKAKDLAESDREWEKFNKEYRRYCK